MEERNFESKKSAEENYRGEENPLGFTEIGTLLAIGDDFDVVFGIFKNDSQIEINLTLLFNNLVNQRTKLCTFFIALSDLKIIQPVEKNIYRFKNSNLRRWGLCFMNKG